MKCASTLISQTLIFPCGPARSKTRLHYSTSLIIFHETFFSKFKVKLPANYLFHFCFRFPEALAR
jgi:hypothetical protein